MRQRKISFRHESLQNQESIRKILKAITQGIAEGKVKFSDEDDEIRMEPQGLLHFKLTASQEENRNRINIKISWQDDNKSPPKKKSLNVSSK